MPLDILLLGPQGAGKGTQARRIAAEYGIPQIATGEMLRAAISDGTPLGKEVESVVNAGELVSDELMIALIRERLAQEDTRSGFILDGFPRTTAQAEALDQLLSEIGRSFSVVFALLIPDAVAFERLRLRAQLEGRADDTDDAIRRRLANYHRETEPLIEHYRARGSLVPIHGDRSEGEVFAEIQRALDQAAERPVRDSGPVEGVWGNREVPPAQTRRRRSRLSAQRTRGGGLGEPGGSPGEDTS